MSGIRSCPICGSTSESELFAESRFDPKQLNEFAFASRKLPEYMHHQLMLCRPCDLVYVSSTQELPDLQTAYEEAAFDSGQEAAFAARTYARILSREFPKLPDRKGSVDIGTGDGAFLKELLQAGFSDVSGVEPSRAPVAAAQPDIRPLIRSGLFQDGMFTEGSCSLVTCFQTIEHVADPMALCSSALKLLKPGGILCLVGHNRRSLSARLLGRKSPIYDIEHLQLFSPASFRMLLEKSGCREVHVRPFWNRYPVTYWARLFPFPGSVKTTLIRGLERCGGRRISVPLPAGNLVAWGVR